MKLISEVTFSTDMIPVTSVGGMSRFVAGNVHIDPVTILEEDNDTITLGEKFNVIFYDKFLGGVLPYEYIDHYYTDISGHRVWRCYVDRVEYVTPGTSVFSVEKTHAIGKLTT